MLIKRSDIDHIAQLAKLDLSEDEKEKFSHQLGDILAYVNQLQAVDTSGVEITAQVSGLTDVCRVDDIKPWDEEELEASLAQGEREGRYIKVKKVL